MIPVLTTLGWVPDFARGFVRDHRVRWACEEVGLRYDTRLLSGEAIKEDDYRSLQPFGQVPAWDDGEVELFESGAIVLRVARLAPGLMPEDAAGQARAEQWLIAALNSVEPMLFDLIFCDLFEADKPWSQARRPAVVERVRERLVALSHALGDKPWLDGDAFTAGDLLMVGVLRGVTDRAIIAEFPNLVDYVARGKARPAFKRSMADHLAVFEAADRERAPAEEQPA